MSETPTPSAEGADETTPTVGPSGQAARPTSADQKTTPAAPGAGDALVDDGSKDATDDEGTKGTFTYAAI